MTEPAPALRHADAVCNACSAGLSVVCMSSMATALAATGAAAGAGAAGMGGIAASGGALSVLPIVFDTLGLGALNHLPNDLLQPLLVVFLALTVAAAYAASRSHGRRGPLLLSAASAVLMYVSIYGVTSDALYVVSFAGLLGATLWAIALSRRTPRLIAELR